jgi:formylglycine-generating enzyme required for sulfatase activity
LLPHPPRPITPCWGAGNPGHAAAECFPSALSYKLDAASEPTGEAEELLAADAREDGDGKHLALAKVVAALVGLSPDEIFRRADRERRAAARRKRRVQTVVGGLAALLIVGLVGWWKQDYLRQQYYWYFVMHPSVLSAARESALKPGDQFKECANGCPEMVVIPAGKFTMGSPEFGEDPQHEVTIAKPFAIGKYELTFVEWDTCVAAGGCPFVADSNWGRDKRPAINVSWEDAKQYLAWLSRVTGEAYRLPSEAEWEYAARAGTTTPYSFGEDESSIGEYAWYVENGEGTNWVGEKKPNPFGLYDMHGNVEEWVEDCMHVEGYEGASADGSAWIDGCESVSVAVVRGGAWDSSAAGLRSTARMGMGADARLNNIGFRIARTLSQ